MAVADLLELPSAHAPEAAFAAGGPALPNGRPGADNGRTGALPLLVLSAAAVAGAIAAAVAVAVLHAATWASARSASACWSSALTGGTVLGIRAAPRRCPVCPGAGCWRWPSASPAWPCC